VSDVTDSGSGVDPHTPWEALAEHRASVERVLVNRDPAEIKRLYIDLGELLSEAVGADIDQVPLLSLPETIPVVGGLMREVEGRVLDAGCGPNPALSILLGRDPGRQLVAVDIGLGTVRLARAVAARANVLVRAVVADVESLPFRDAVFAGIACDDTIEHLPHDRQGVHELGRVLAPTGRAVIATPNRHSAEVLWRKGADLLRRQPKPASAYYAASSHLREYTWASLERIVRPDLMVRRRSAVGWSGGWKRRLASRLTSTPPLRRFSRMVVVEACHHRLRPE